MRRNSFNNRAINPLYILFALSLVYALFSTMFYYLTPLIGVSFYYLIENFDKEYYEIDSFFIFVYVSFMEINNGLFVFSFIAFFLIFHKFILSYIKEIIECNWCLPIIYIFIGYIGYYIFNIFISDIFNLENPDITFAYLVFILSDIILVYTLL